MSQIKTIAIPWWAQLLMGAIVAIIFLRFCDGKKDNTLQKIAAAIQKQHLEDSIKYSKREKELKDSAHVIRQQLAANKLLLTNKDTELANTLAQNKVLIKKYNQQWHGMPVDTSATLVPAAFVNDCKDCFTQLEKTTDQAEQYKYQADQMQVLWMSQAAIDSARIMECDSARLRANKSYNDLRMAVEINTRSLEPRRKLKVGIAGRFDNQFLPSGVGPGIMYEDKKDRSFGFRPIYGNQQPAYILDVHVPLFSF